MKTAEEILNKHLPKRTGYPVEAITKEIMEAMDEYAGQQCDNVQELFTKPQECLKPLEELYRQEHPDPQGRFYLPDRTRFFKWIVGKILKQENTFKQVTTINTIKADLDSFNGINFNLSNV